MRRHHRSLLFALLALVALFLAASWPAFAQGKPDLVWMRGGHSDPVKSFAYSADGKFLASCAGYFGDRSVKFWRLSDGMLLRTILPADNPIAVAITPDDASLVYLDQSYNVEIYTVPAGSHVRTLSTSPAQAISMALSPDGSVVALGMQDSTIRLIRLSDGTLLTTLTGHTGPVETVAFSYDGLLLASGSGGGSGDQTVKIWNAVNGSLLQSSSINNSGYADFKIAFSPDNTAAITELINTMNVALVHTSGTVDYFDPVGGNVYGIAVSPSSGLSGVGSSLNGGGYIGIFQPNWINTSNITGDGHMGAFALEPDGQSLVGASAWTILMGIWNTADGSFVRELAPPGGAVWNLAVSPDGQSIASSGENSLGAMVFRKPSDGSVYFEYDASLIAASYSPDGTRCVCSFGNDLIMFRTSDGAILYDIKSGDAFEEVEYSPDDKYVVTRLYSGAYNVYNAADLSLAFTHPDIGSGFRFSPDGKRIAAVVNGGFGLYSWPSLNLVATGSTPGGNNTGTVRPLNWYPDSSALVFLQSNYPVGVYAFHVPDLSPLWNTSLTVDQLDSACVSPDGQVVAVTGQDDAKLHLLNASNGQVLTEYSDETWRPTGYWGGVLSVAYSPNGKFIYYGRGDGTLCAALNPYRNAVFPDHGGNTGNVTVTIITPDTFSVATDVQVKLTATGTTDISGDSPIVSNPHVVTTTFNLTGASLGVRTLVITNTDGSTLSYPQGFTIEQGITPQVVTDIVGQTDLRAGPYQTYQAVITNQGNVDANVADLRIEVPNWFNWQLIGYQPQNVFMGDDNTSFGVQVPTIPANGSVTVPFQVEVEDVLQNGHRPFDLLAWANIDPSSKTDYIGDGIEPRIVRVEDNTGTTLDVLGTLNNGVVASIAGFGATAADGSSASIALDTMGRPTLMQLSDGSSVAFTWSSDTAGSATFIPNSGPPIGPKPIMVPPGTFEPTLIQPPLQTPPSCDRLRAYQKGVKVVCKAVDALDLTCELFGPEDPLACIPALAAEICCYIVEKDLENLINTHCFNGQSTSAGDPNDLEGPAGYGTAQWVPRAQPLPYTVFFSNDPNASAPAQNIMVTDQLDPINLDLTSLSLGGITIGNHQATPTLETSPPVGAKQYDYDLDLRPDNNIIAHIHASLDMLLGTLTYSFQSLDPSTGLPTTDPNAGLLPPGVEGTVQFFVVPKTTSPTGTVTSNQATIVFDYNPAMSTSVWPNTLDNDPPVSHVNKLAATQKLGYFTVKWLGTDTINGIAGSGLANYTIYVSDNGGAYTPWLTNTTETSSVFIGVGGHTYAFYSIATDNAGNIQPTPTTPDATTKVPLALLSFVVSPNTIVGSQSTAGTITMDSPVSSDTLIKLTSSSSAVLVPATVTVPAGASSVSFGISTTAVTATTTASIKASYNGGTLSKSLKVLPIGVQTVSLSPNPVTGGNSTTGTVTLTAPAAPGNITVSFASSDTAVVPTPASITIPAGSQTKTFTVNTNHVTAKTTVTLKATANGITKSIKLTVTP